MGCSEEVWFSQIGVIDCDAACLATSWRPHPLPPPYLYACKHACQHVRTRARAHTHAHTNAHISARTRIHAHTQTHTHTWARAPLQRTTACSSSTCACPPGASSRGASPTGSSGEGGGDLRGLCAPSTCSCSCTPSNSAPCTAPHGPPARAQHRHRMDATTCKHATHGRCTGTGWQHAMQTRILLCPRTAPRGRPGTLHHTTHGRQGTWMVGTASTPCSTQPPALHTPPAPPTPHTTHGRPGTWMAGTRLRTSRPGPSRSCPAASEWSARAGPHAWVRCGALPGDKRAAAVPPCLW